jgi:voltage-gated sodium channel
MSAVMDARPSWSQRAAALVGSKGFERFIIGLILFNGLIVGLETVKGLSVAQHHWLVQINHLILFVFTVEVLLKLLAVAPQFGRYFRDGWNLFDFTIVALSFIPATGPLATLARLLRVLRVLRLISALPELRLIVSTLVRSIPGMANVLMLMGILFYIYAVAGFHLFHDVAPEYWGSLGTALLTLFQLVTLESWTAVMQSAMAHYPWAWAYFISFIVIGTFVVINLFIAVVINNLYDAKDEAMTGELLPPSKAAILRELEQTHEALARLKAQLEKLPH